MENKERGDLIGFEKFSILVYEGKNLVLVTGFPTEEVVERADEIISKYKKRVISTEFIPARRFDHPKKGEWLEYDQILIRIQPNDCC